MVQSSVCSTASAGTHVPMLQANHCASLRSHSRAAAARLPVYLVLPQLLYTIFNTRVFDLEIRTFYLTQQRQHSSPWLNVHSMNCPRLTRYAYRTIPLHVPLHQQRSPRMSFIPPCSRSNITSTQSLVVRQLCVRYQFSTRSGCKHPPVALKCAHPCVQFAA